MKLDPTNTKLTNDLTNVYKKFLERLENHHIEIISKCDNCDEIERNVTIQILL